MPTSKRRLFLRIFFWLVGSIVGLLLLLFLALQLPVTQRLVTNKVENIARSTLNTDLGIGHIDINWLDAITVEDIYLNNPSGDSIARLDRLYVAIDLFQLISQTVEITDVEIEGVFARVITTDSSSNIQFLLDQFAPVDSLARVDSLTTIQDTTRSPWTIIADGTTLGLSRADILYQDDPIGIYLDLELDKLNGALVDVDLERGNYNIDYLELNGADVSFRQLSVPTLDTTISNSPPMLLTADRLTVAEVNAEIQVDSMQMLVSVPRTELEGSSLRLGEIIAFNGAAFNLQNAAFELEQPGPATPATVINYNHLMLTEIQASADDIAFVGDSLHISINQLAAKEQSGLKLDSTKGSVIYTPTLLALNDFLLRSGASELRSPATEVNYAFTEQADLATLATDLSLSGYLGLADLARFTPDLARVPLVKNNLNKQFTFNVQANGNGQDLRIGLLRLSGPGVELNTTADIQYPFDTSRLAARVNILDLDVRPGPVIPLLPDSTVPPDIDWPERILARGTIDYENEKLALNLNAYEDRPNPLNLRSKVYILGEVKGLTTFPATYLDLSLDTLLATRTTIFAYLPANALPDGYRIPDYLRASGSVEGPMENLLVDIRFNLPGEKTYASLNGRIENVLDPANLTLDLALKNLAVAALDVRNIIPDTLLPANFNLPDLKVNNARVQGGLDDLQFSLPLNTSNGNWDISGQYRPDDLDIELNLSNFQLAQLFTGNVRDTLETLALEPLNLKASIEGRIEPSLQLSVSAVASEVARGQLLDLQALIEENTYSGEFTITHPDFAAQGAGLYSLGQDSVATAFASVTLDRVDLQRWDITEVPLFLSGELEFDAAGLNPYNTDAALLLDDVLLRGENGSSFVDSFSVVALLQNRKNTITIASDVLEAELAGTFDPLAVGDELQRFLSGYWEAEVTQPDPFVNGQELNFDLRVKRTQPLTGGLIAGLTELRPFELHFEYQEANPGLILSGLIPELKYAGIEIDQLRLEATGDQNVLDFDVNIDYLAFGEQLELGRTQFSGGNKQGAIVNELKVWDGNDSLRHRLSFRIDPEADSLTLSLQPTQRINFKSWRVPPSNLIAIVGPNLIVNNFALENGRQRLAAQTVEPNDVEIELSNFELGTIARLFNTEEQLFAGVVNGTASLDNVMSNLGIQADLNATDIKVLQTPIGDLRAEVDSENELTYLIDATLTDAGNQLSINGTYVLNGAIDLEADLEKLTLKSAEPFSLGYLKNTDGYLTGKLEISGTATAPRINGDLTFKEAALEISLLGARFRISDDPIRLRGANITMDGLKLYDSRDGVLDVFGGITINSIDNIELDIRANTERFLALDSDKTDNELYYGDLAVAAEVEIGGRARLPVMDIEARPVGDNEVTYVYTIPEDKGARLNKDIISFIDQEEWKNVLRNDTIIKQDSLGGTGVDIRLNLDINDDLLVNVIVDPVSGQTFSGRANGDLALRQFPDGRQEMTGRVELVAGKYDFNFQGVIRREFNVVPGSSATFRGDINNPELDLNIRYAAKTEPLPLVTALNPAADVSGLRRQQTFYVNIGLEGDLTSANINTNLTYPEDLLGNSGNPLILSSLRQLRQDQSRLTRTAFSLLAFNTFNVPILDAGTGGGGIDGTINGTLDKAMTQYLNSLTGSLVGFVDLDFGIDSYQGADGSTNRNLRLSLRKTLFDDRVIISVDGIAGSDEEAAPGNGQTYLDNITAEYLIDESGNLRLKFFNDRNRDILVGGNVIRFGGRLVFSKEFDRFFWSPNK